MTGSGGPAPEAGAATGRHDHNHRPALDGLRAVAVAGVLLFHLGHLPGGNLGVDAFFVLSGWLITWRLLAEADRSPRPTIDLRRFWAARVRRLMPASLAVIVTVAVVWGVCDIAVPSLRRDLVWALGWASNWGTISAGGDYWSRFGEPSPITHFWSLAIEEQFYLVWPVVILVLVRLGGRHRRLVVGVVSAALAVASIVTMVAIFEPALPTAAYMNTFARAHSLLIGAIAAAITVSVGPRLRGAVVARRAMPVAALVAVAIVVMVQYRWQWLFSWGFPVFAVAMAVVVVAAADGAMVRVLGSTGMRWIGDRSYGIYLWHWPVILLLSPDRSHIDGVTLDVVRVGVSIGLAAASYRYLETPIRRRRRMVARWAPGAAMGALVTSVAVVMVSLPTSVGSASPSTVTLPPAPTAAPTVRPASTESDVSSTADTSPETTVPQPTRQAAVLNDAPAPTLLEVATTAAAAASVDDVGIVSTRVVTISPGDVSGTEFSAPAVAMPETAMVITIEPIAPIRVLVAGDSTALHLADALLPYVAAYPDQIVAGNASFPGCGLTAANDGRLHEFSNEDGSRELIDLSGCTQQWASIAHRVASAEQIDVVLVEIGAWDGVDIHLADGRVVSVADPVGRLTVDEAYRSFVVVDIEDAGAQVVWVTPPDIHLQWDQIDAPVNDPQRWIAMRQIIDSLPVEQIDLRSWLIAEGLDGPAGRPDGVHLAAEVNVRFVDEVVAKTLIALAR